MDIQYQWVAKRLNVTVNQVENTIQLLSEGNTVPFIARYRKEMTKGLDEEQIRLIYEHVEYQKNLAKRKEDVLRLIEVQDKLTDELQAQIMACTQLSEVEDLYRPYQQKRKTRASDAIAKGLEGLADYLMSFYMEGDVSVEAKNYVSEQVLTVEDALQGAMDIIAERVADHPEIRQLIRYNIQRHGVMACKLKKHAEDSQQVYKMYYEYKERISTIAPHRMMAINRGEGEKILSVSMDYPQEQLMIDVFNKIIKVSNSIGDHYVKSAIKDGLKRLAFSAIEREIRNDLTDKAHEQSIDVFTKNLERLLLQPPLKQKMILGVDPAYRTGCKLAVIDVTGKVLAITAIYPHPPQNQPEEAMKICLDLFKQYQIEVIAIGNGTASRETEAFIALFLKTYELKASYTIVSEAGASVYSASDIARLEFPDLQVEQRSAISIARRLLDPLAELIKIDPQSIGVGQYQHDLPINRLKERLDFAVSKVVNRVGVDINTASEPLLVEVSGLSKKSAKAIVDYRNQNGEFTNRDQLKTVKSIGEKAFEQAAGFLRIRQGDNWLDATAIHPESYPLVNQLSHNLQLEEIDPQQRIERLKNVNITQIAQQLQSDEYTISDVITTLSQPLRDYRDQYDGPLLRSDILTLNDLKEGMKLEGVVRNIVDFGVFVDIGLKNDGLVHISKMSKQRIKHPMDVVAIGDIVTVWVIGIDHIRNKVQLSLISETPKS